MAKENKAQRWIVLIIVALVGGLITKLPYLKDSYYSALNTANGLSNTQFAMLLTMYGIINTIVYIPGGFLADRISPKKLVFVSCLGTGAVGIWYSFLPSYPFLIVIHGLMGITTVFTFWAAMVKIANNLGRGEEQGRMFGVLEGGRGLFATFASLISVYVFSKAAGDVASEVAGLRGVILYYSILLIIVSILVAIFVKDPDKVSGAVVDEYHITLSDYLTVVKIPRVWICGLVVFCNYTAVIFFGYLTPYLTDIYGLSTESAAIIGTFRSYVLMFLASVVAGALADKIHSVLKFWTYGYIGMAIFSFVYLMIPSNQGMLWIVVVNFILHGMCLLAVKALYFAPIDELRVDKHLAGSASGIISIVGYAPEMFAYTMAGQFLDNYPGVEGFNRIFIACGIFSIAGFLLVLLLRYMNNAAIKKAAA